MVEQAAFTLQTSTITIQYTDFAIYLVVGNYDRIQLLRIKSEWFETNLIGMSGRELVITVNWTNSPSGIRLLSF